MADILFTSIFTVYECIHISFSIRHHSLFILQNKTTMKILKILGTILLIVVALYLVLCVAGPKRLDVSAVRDMDVSVEAAYAQVIHLKNWEAWGPWLKEDPEMQMMYGDIVSGPGASYSWKSEKVGNGQLRVLETVPQTSIRNELQFEGFGGVSYGKWTFEPLEGGVKSRVSWGIEDGSDSPFLMRGFLLLMEGNARKMFEDGLESLEIAAQAAPPLSDELEELEIHGITYMALRRQMTIDSTNSMAAFFQDAYGKIGAYLGPRMANVGAPVSLTWTWDEEAGTTDMAAAIPLAPAPDPGQPNETIATSAGNMHVYDTMLVFDYYGPYEGVKSAYTEMMSWLAAQGKEMIPPSVEQYVTDPGTEPDPAKWLTKVYVYF